VSVCVFAVFRGNNGGEKGENLNAAALADTVELAIFCSDRSTYLVAALALRARSRKLSPGQI
jgi:hypothetical protein